MVPNPNLQALQNRPPIQQPINVQHNIPAYKPTSPSYPNNRPTNIHNNTITLPIFEIIEEQMEQNKKHKETLKYIWVCF